MLSVKRFIKKLSYLSRNKDTVLIAIHDHLPATHKKEQLNFTHTARSVIKISVSPTNCPAKCTGYPSNSLLISPSMGPLPTKARRAPGFASNTGLG